MGLPKAYSSKDYEADIYQLWEEQGVFKADPTSEKERFSISMPPPNETGTLHVGHALFITLQDILIRHARQQGKDALWLAGTDHAALSTNAIIEKRLAEQGTNKHELGREDFLRQTKEFVAGSRNTINKQLRAMGASVDWSRARYTLDEALNRCVNEVFVKMYNDGLIYRGHRIVNWDPNLETTVSDDEVVYKEQKSPLYTLQYGPFQITTARPETKFGDKYVVMHPDDKRFEQYIDGSTFEVEWLNGKVTATVVKDEAVNPEFGTGVMTITPWHDHTDFEIAERHGLEKEQIIGFDGKLLPVAQEFSGMTIEEARPKIVAKLEEKGLLVSTDDKYKHNIALNDRGKGVIEPQIKLQWFVDVNRPAVNWKGQLRSLREVMRAVIDDGDIKIIPRRFEKVYFRWIDNLRDWNISRQIWWGHRIPVWIKGDETYVGVQPPKDDGWLQDPDTLDTWFSSALWTWSTLIEPDLAKDYSLTLNDLLDQSLDFKTYHPTTVMETGWDILFFWVARMILATTYATGQIPFKTVYLHGLVRTESGKKMSKSDPETIIDPMEVIPEFGTDALRLALVSGTGAGNDQRLGKSKIVDNRNFCNKLWNVARYIESLGATSKDTDYEPESAADHWILNMLSISAELIEKQLANFNFGEAYQTMYHFVWDDLADWYVEASKQAGNPAWARYILENTLKLVHPFAPFVSEAIWQAMGGDESNLLAAQPGPQLKDFKPEQAKVQDFEKLKAGVEEIRRVSAVTGVIKPSLYADIANPELLKRLARLGAIEMPGDEPKGLRLSSLESAWLDVDPQKYLDELKAQASQKEASIKALEARLANDSYVKNAPEELVEETKSQLETEKSSLKQLQAELASLE